MIKATTENNELIAVARACYKAYETKDRAALEKIIAADFHFTSPLDNRLDRATYFERCWKNSDKIKSFNFINLVPEGNRVFVTYEAHNTDGSAFRNMEIITVKKDRIVAVEVYFGWNVPHKAASGDSLPPDKK